LSLRTRHDAQNQRVRIEVADSGPGVPREIRARVFDPFFTTKPDGEGTGLGLALARGIVEGHGGAIAVESSPREGARFVIELLVDTPPGAADERDDLVAAGTAILVVDDEPAVASLLAEALSRDGSTWPRTARSRCACSGPVTTT
jgi:Histidine kinase-, DNA gyrase B-, and HSP90-like ATPase